MIKCRHCVWLFTKEVVEDCFTESPVDFHEISQAIKILSGRDPVGFLSLLRLLTRIIESEEASLRGERGDNNIYYPFRHSAYFYLLLPGLETDATELQVDICLSPQSALVLCVHYFYLLAVVHHEVCAAHRVGSLWWRNPKMTA